MQGLDGQCDSGAPHGLAAVWAVKSCTAAQLCQLPSWCVRDGFAQQQPVGYLRHGEPAAFLKQAHDIHLMRQRRLPDHDSFCSQLQDFPVLCEPLEASQHDFIELLLIFLFQHLLKQ